MPLRISAITRSPHLRRLSVAVLAIGLSLTPAVPISSNADVNGRKRVAPGLPNILIIITDDQRAHGTFGVMPQTRSWFADQGTHFENNFATTPLCAPSRAGLLTGEYAHNSGIHRGEISLYGALQDHSIEFALRENGYQTGLFGKFLNGWPNNTNPPYFNQWATTPLVTYSGAQWNVNGTTETVNQYSTSFIGSNARGFIAQATRAGTPWFAYVAFHAPHMPATPARRFARASVRPFHLDPAMAERNLRDKPPWVRSSRAPPSKVRSQRATMLRSLMSVDQQVGLFRAQLRSLGQLSNTLAFYTSDNGYMWGEHRQLAKDQPYLPSTQVPLYVCWPGHVAAGAVDTRLSALIDIAPTIYASTGITPPGPMDGVNLLDPTAKRRLLLLEYWSGVGMYIDWRAIVRSRYEYVEYRDPATQKVIFREYYDLVRDPYQLTNLLYHPTAALKGKVTAISASLTTLSTCAQATCPH
jgi:arylsulfatase A-like enzyme